MFATVVRAMSHSGIKLNSNLTITNERLILEAERVLTTDSDASRLERVEQKLPLQ